MKRSPLSFRENVNPFTLGVEMELQVLDASTLLLTPRSTEIVNRLQNNKIKHEFFQSSLEIVTGVCQDAHEVGHDFTETLQLVKPVAEGIGLKLASTGTHPEADYRDRLVTPSKRYYELMDRNQWIIRRMAVYGMHIHIGMRSGDECIKFHNFFLHFVPHLLALSASSPFWQRIHTGLASSRPTMYEAMPTSGMPHIVKSWLGFQKMYNGMVRSKSIKSVHDLWLDLRPSPELGTLEIRVCDQPATHAEALAIVAFVHVLACWYDVNRDRWEATHKKLHRWIFRENKWRAIRYGLGAEIIRTDTKKNISVCDDISQWIEELGPLVKQFGYERHFYVLESILKLGNSADRQLAVFQRSHELHEVIKHNVHEFESGMPAW
jgi:carboxylate-amine ligase